MNITGSPDVKTAAGVGRDEELGIKGQLARDDYSLLVAAREGRNWLCGERGTNSEAGDLFCGKTVDNLGWKQKSWGQRIEHRCTEEEIFFDGESKSQAFLSAVLGNERNSGLTHTCRCRSSDPLVSESQRALTGSLEADQYGDQLS